MLIEEGRRLLDWSYSTLYCKAILNQHSKLVIQHVMEITGKTMLKWKACRVRDFNLKSNSTSRWLKEEVEQR